MDEKMKARQPKQQTTVTPDPRSEEDSDLDMEMERNFALLRNTVPETTKEANKEEEEEGSGSDEEEDESGSDGGEEDQEGLSGEDEQEGDSDEGSDDDDNDDDDDDEDEQTEGEAEREGAGTSQLEDQGGDGQTEDDIKKELATMSFQEVLALQNTVGSKAFKEIAYGDKHKAQLKPAANKKRLNKNRPMEMSAKHRAPFLRQVAPVKKKVLRDPRFDDLSGEYKPQIFEQTYKFINDLRKREKEVVSKKFKAIKKDTKKKEELAFLLKRMENQERARQQREEQREKELDFKRRQRAMAGNQPFFLKKSDKKKMELADKYNQLKKSGKLENFLSKKRKRNATKDRRKLPFQNPKPQ